MESSHFKKLFVLPAKDKEEAQCRVGEKGTVGS